VKILCLCEGGNVRSVACSYLLKYMHGQDALAASIAKNSAATLVMLCEWADKIIVVERMMKIMIAHKFQSKISVYDVGPDRWGNAFHPQLLEFIEGLIQQDTEWPKGEEHAVHTSK